MDASETTKTTAVLMMIRLHFYVIKNFKIIFLLNAIQITGENRVGANGSIELLNCTKLLCFLYSKFTHYFHFEKEKYFECLGAAIKSIHFIHACIQR